MNNPDKVAKTLKWQDPSKFSVHIYPKGSESVSHLKVEPEKVTAAITNIQLAEINTDPVDEWVGEEWRFSTGRLDFYTVTLTFKDYENFELYRMWTRAIQDFARVYPDDQKFDIMVQTATDYDITSFIPTVLFMDCILVTVSGPTLDNAANASIAEFTVTAKSSYVVTVDK
jgi:hypothetical protein